MAAEGGVRISLAEDGTPSLRRLSGAELPWRRIEELEVRVAELQNSVAGARAFAAAHKEELQRAYQNGVRYAMESGAALARVWRVYYAAGRRKTVPAAELRHALMPWERGEPDG